MLGLGWVNLERGGTTYRQPVRKLPDESLDQLQPLSTTVQSDPWLCGQIVISIDLVGPKVGEIGQDEVDRLLEPGQQVAGPELDSARAQSVGVLLSDRKRSVRYVDGCDRDLLRSTEGDSDRDCAAAGSDIDHARVGPICEPRDGPFDEQLGLWSRRQDRRGDDEVATEELLVTEDVRDRLAVCPALKKPVYGTDCLVRNGVAETGEELGSRQAKGMTDQQLGIEPRRAALGQASLRCADGLGDRGQAG